ncbi:MAG: type IV toxin-antitoxin system AbiEi family antitoxin domain-containing protein [Acidimicrobiia bacterium]
MSTATHGVFRFDAAAALGVTRNQLTRLTRQGVLERVHPGTYRMTASLASAAQQLQAALLWGGDRAAAAGRSAAALYRLEGVTAAQPEIVLPADVRGRLNGVTVSHCEPRALMVRSVAGFRATGVECTLVRLAHVLDAEAFEIAFEDARRRRLTSVPALRRYLDRFAAHGRRGVVDARRLLSQVDPAQPARSTLEVKTRRLLVARGLGGFVREFPLEWGNRRYLYDFAFPDARVILETNGRRWHDDTTDYERDHEKWSVPGRLGYRILFATWDKVTRRPEALVQEITSTIAR